MILKMGYIITKDLDLIFERREFLSQSFEFLLKAMGRDNAITHQEVLVQFLASIFLACASKLVRQLL